MYTSANTAPMLTVAGSSVSITQPNQITPSDVAIYLRNMDFQPTASAGVDLWYRSNMSGYFTWEQAVAYCLVKPWLSV